MSTKVGGLVYFGKSMPESDADLLNAFAARRDEEVFRVLAGRHLGLVFHAALRRTGNRPLAEEISQNVLCALAAKAGSLARHPERLSAWLHRATLYESTKAMRSETSRRRREQLADLHGEASQGAALADALPHLDPALDQLGEADRRLLLLHYYEGRSFPDIAGLLGKSTVAVQKQSQRALEKLARMLRGKGVTLSVVALASVLSGEFAKAASPSLTSSVVAAVLAKSGGSSTGLALFMAMKSKALIPVALLIAVIPLIFLEVAISRAEQRNEVIRSHHSLSTSTPQPSVMPAGLRSTISKSTDLMVLFKECRDAQRGGPQMMKEFIAKLAALDRETLRRLTRETVAIRTQFRAKSGLLWTLVAAMAKVDPEFAVKTAVEALAPTPSSSLWEDSYIPVAYCAWALRDPEQARAWLRAEERSGALRPSQLTIFAMFSADKLEAGLAWSLISRKYPLLEEYMQERLQSKGTSLSGILIQSLQQGPPAENEPVAGDLEWAKNYLAISRDYVPEKDQAVLFQAMLNRFNPTDPASLGYLTLLIQDPALAPEDRVQFARQVMVARANGSHFVESPEAKRRHAEETRNWLSNVLPAAETTELLNQLEREQKQGNPNPSAP